MTDLRILHVIPSVSLGDGGPTRAIALMERGLTQLGVAVTTLTSDYALSVSRPDAYASRVYKHLWTPHYKIAPGMLPFLWRHVRDFDVVHIHALFSFSSTAAAWCARMFQVPYVVRPLGTLSAYGVRHRRPRLKRMSIATIEAPILTGAAAVHFTSEIEAEEARRVAGQLRSVIIPLGLDAPALASREAVQRLRQRMAGRRPILFLSRLDPKKNLEGLIEAFAGSASLRAKFALMIAGSGDPAYQALLGEKVRRAGIADIVHWLGHIEGDEKAAAFAIADAFVLPSYSENFGIAAVEAMLAGLPCILTPGVAIAQAVAAAHGAEVVSVEPAAIAGAIERVASDEIRRIEMGARAMTYAQKEFSVEAMGRRLVELYGNIRRSKAHPDGKFSR